MITFDPERDYIDEFIQQWNAHVSRTKAGMIVLGVVLALVGVAAFVAPLSMYVFLQAFIAVALIVHGVGQIAGYFQTNEMFRNGATLAAGILNALLGALVFVMPTVLTASMLVYALSFMLIINGVERISFARTMRYYRLHASSPGIATGALNIILGIVFLLMPFFSGLMLGYLLGAYLVVGGITLVVEGASMKKIER